MVIIGKIFASIFALIVLSRSIVDYRSHKESLVMTVFWIVVWLGISTIAFFPNIIDKSINFFGGNRSGIGTVFGMGLVFVMFISYRIYVKANRVEKNIAKLSRKIALSKIKLSKKKK